MVAGPKVSYGCWCSAEDGDVQTRAEGLPCSAKTNQRHNAPRLHPWQSVPAVGTVQS